MIFLFGNIKYNLIKNSVFVKRQNCLLNFPFFKNLFLYFRDNQRQFYSVIRRRTLKVSFIWNILLIVINGGKNSGFVWGCYFCSSAALDIIAIASYPLLKSINPNSQLFEKTENNDSNCSKSNLFCEDLKMGFYLLN